MKLKKHLPLFVDAFKEIDKEILLKHIEIVKNDSSVKDLKTRVIFDCFYFIPNRYNLIDTMKKDYDFNDNHLETLLKKAFETVFEDIKI